MAKVVSPAVDPPDMRASVAAALESAAGDGKFADLESRGVLEGLLDG